MDVKTTEIKDLYVIEPKVFKDNRGFFLENYNHKRYAEVGIDVHFIQDNHSRSQKNTLRGLHYQINPGQGKLIYVGAGEIFDVAVDIRRNSPTFGQWFGINLSAESKNQLYIPVGFAHGFCVLTETAEVFYKCTDYYSPKNERGIMWNDPTLAIDWPVTSPILSERDKNHPPFANIERDF